MGCSEFRCLLDIVTAVLNKINLSIKPGENLALVGPSGAGERRHFATLFKVLCGFGGKHQRETDILTLDGCLISHLRSHIGMVQQDVYLFSILLQVISLMENQERQWKKIEQAAELAGADEFIRERCATDIIQCPVSEV